MINDRRKKILQAIIEEYIRTAMPISSNSLINFDDLNYSSATIRNEMAELEKNGLIKKTHTSSGRIPSEKGYRYYVNKLLNNSILSSEEIEYISSQLENKIADLDELTKITAKIISEITNYATVSIDKKITDEIVQEIKLVKLTNNLLLVIIITKNNIIKETIIQYDKQVPDDFIDAMSILFNSNLVGKKLQDIDISLDELLIQSTKGFAQFVLPVVKQLKNSLKDIDHIHFEGTNNLLKYPEFDNIDSIKNIMNIINQKQIIDEIIDQIENARSIKNNCSNISITIGSETREQLLEDFSIVTYSNNNQIGRIGIIRPQRMDYAKVISVIEYINKKIEEMEKLDGSEKH